MNTQSAIMSLPTALPAFRIVVATRGSFPWMIATVLLALLWSAGSAQAQAVVAQSNWKLHLVDSQDAANPAVSAFDGNPATFWHTQWIGGQPPPPHQIQINLGAVHQVSGFRYLPRADSANGRIAKYEFYVSSNGSTWGAAVASGTFANTATEQQVLFTAKAGQYIRLRALTEVGGRPFTAVAELNVLAAVANQAPNSTIATPSSAVTIAPGQTVNFSGSGIDPEGSPLTYAWAFGGGAPASATSQNPGNVTFATAGVYTVSLAVRDAQNLVDPTPATVTVTVQATATLPIIPQAGWTVHLVDSQDTASGNGATKAFDGVAATFWHTEWVSAQPPPPHELQVNLGGVYQVRGFKYLPRADSANGRIAGYEFYVSTDGRTWGTPVASGTFPSTATEQQVLFTAKVGQYVRLRQLSEVNGRAFGTVAELNVVGSVVGMGNQAPESVITGPSGATTILPGQSVTFTGAGSDPESSALTYAWAFPGGSPASSTSANAGAVRFATAGVYIATLTVRDAQNAADLTPATVRITVQNAAAPIAQTKWSLHSVDSQDSASGNTAVKAFDGSATTFWHTEWVSGQPPPPHDLQINLGAIYPVSGFKYLARQDGANGRIAQYEFYVSSDGSNWGAAVAAGTFADVTTEQQVAFTAKTGQFVRLRALSEVNGSPFSALAELNVLSTSAGIPANEWPYITLTDVGAGAPYAAPAALALRAAATDRDGTITRVDFYANSVLLQTDTVSTYDFALSNVTPGTYLFVAVARDNTGNTTVSNTITITIRDASLPGNVLFTPSAEHDTMVQRYVVGVFAAGSDPASATPLATLDIGKPAIVNGGCRADVRSLLASLPDGTYVATVTAIAAAETAQSDQSAPFIF